jgi:hypothetical protein
VDWASKWVFCGSWYFSQEGKTTPEMLAAAFRNVFYVIFGVLWVGWGLEERAKQLHITLASFEKTC